MNTTFNKQLTIFKQSPYSKQKKTKYYKIETTKELGYYKLFWIFFIGCFLGVVFETIWCLLTRHHYENRSGVIYGPFNPVYGLGAILLTISLKRLCNKRDLWIFLGSMIIGSAFEYICSFIQQIVFGTVSWEYSNTQLNIGGRTNVMFAFFWGILGLLWVKEFYPRLSALIDMIPKAIGKWLTLILSILLFVDILVSAMAVERQSQRRKDVPATNIVSQTLDSLYPDEVLNKIYPNMMAATNH